ncbi:MAG: YqeG family HAD IIIA-type phosphatase [Lachnospiraceae bacterium]|nr:YqeG family HAD IIIA-type phosphatase [Lachnospiraceae bacterium]
MRKGLFRNLLPDTDADSAYEIPYDKLREAGYAGLVFDIDNTLVMHGAPATAETAALFAHLRELGFRCLILSNNREARVKSFAGIAGADYIFKAGKPKKAGYLKALRQMDLPAERVIAVGDQLFTDIWGANRTGMATIRVGPIDPREEIQIVIKRKLEKPFLKTYFRKNKSGTGRGELPALPADGIRDGGKR